MFCTECVELLVGRAVMEGLVESSGRWQCFVCQEYDDVTHGLLRPRPDWLARVRRGGMVTFVR